MLAGPGVERGLIGPDETRRLWDRHLLNCAVVAELVPVACQLVDLGSGAGLPGIVLAMLLPRATVTLLEPLARRTAFLEECVQLLGLDHVTVRRGRAEDLAGQVAADVVTARAVAPLPRLAELAIGLARPGGTVLAIKGAGAAAELAAAGPALRGLGASDAELLTVGSSGLMTPATVIRFRASAAPTGRRRPSGPAGATRGSGIVLPRTARGAAGGKRQASRPGRGSR